MIYRKLTIPLHQKFIKLIEAFYTEKLNISANYLQILCNQFLRLTAKEMIKNRVVLEATNAH